MAAPLASASRGRSPGGRRGAEVCQLTHVYRAVSEKR